MPPQIVARAGTGVPTRTGFRRDIQWMRAVAVLVVIGYHLGLPGFAGGYVGVDVFFALSGYLITRLLLVEAETTGSIDLRAFAARRVRRLLPVSSTVFLVTLGMLLASYGALRLRAERSIAQATSLFAANIGLAAQETDYSTAGNESAFQHYWSLAVEEQFYVLWPALLLLVIVVARRTGRPRDTSLSSIVLVVTLASLAAAAAWTGPRQPLAFFLLPARAWEFSLGGALAIGELRRGLTGRRWQRPLGLVLVAATVLGIGSDLGFPFPLALAPVLGTVLFLWGGIDEETTPRWLAADAMQWIGDRSYALYLWHWPPLVVLGLTDAPWHEAPGRRVAVVVGTFLAAALTYRLIEEPLRRGKLLRGGRAALLTLVALTVVSFTAATVATAGSAATDDSATTADPVITDPVIEWFDAEVLPEPESLPSNVRPSPEDALAQTPAIYADGCHAPLAAVAPLPTEACTFGDPAAARTIALVGDSHAAHWFPGLQALAETDGHRLVVLTKSSCPPFELFDPAALDEHPQCHDWQPALAERLTELQPTVIVIGARAVPEQRRAPEEWAERLTAAVATVRAHSPDAAIIAMLDPPRAPERLPFCVVEQPLADCALTADTDFDAMQREAARSADGSVDTPALLCRDGRCPAVIGDVLVLRDEHHLSAELSIELVPVLRRTIDQALLERRGEAAAD